MSFSTTVRLDNSSDYINPSVTCVVALKPNLQEEARRDDDPKIIVHAKKKSSESLNSLKKNPSENLPGFKSRLESAKKVEISLADCLSCSGCVTSAEEVLVQQHGKENLVKALSEKIQDSSQTLVASIAPQVIADLCAYHGDPHPAITFLRVHSFLTKVIGFHYIMTTEFAESFSADLITAEYLSRTMVDNSSSNSLPLPILTSICPGFVCFIEKQHPALLPHLSRAMSQQSISGVIVNEIFDKEDDHTVENKAFFHLSIQPCFDRKLEASREPNALYTDFVLSTLELVQWMDEKSIDSTTSRPISNSEDPPHRAVDASELFASDRPASWIVIKRDHPHPLLQTLNVDKRFHNTNMKAAVNIINEFWSSQEASTMEGSGGYHRRILMAKWILNMLLSDSEHSELGRRAPSIHYKTRRNTNHQEAYLTDSDTPPREILDHLKRDGKFVTLMYGFQHIQNLTRSLKKDMTAPRTTMNRCIENYSDFIEIMACPGGCLNGSAQTRKTNGPKVDTASRLVLVERHFLEWRELIESIASGNNVPNETKDSSRRLPDASVVSLASLLKKAGGNSKDYLESFDSLYKPFLVEHQRVSPSNGATAKEFLTAADVQW